MSELSRQFPLWFIFTPTHFSIITVYVFDSYMDFSAQNETQASSYFNRFSAHDICACRSVSSQVTGYIAALNDMLGSTLQGVLLYVTVGSISGYLPFLCSEQVTFGSLSIDTTVFYPIFSHDMRNRSYVWFSATSKTPWLAILFFYCEISKVDNVNALLPPLLYH